MAVSADRDSDPSSVAAIDKKLAQLEKQMNKLSRRRDAGKLDEKQFYAEYFPLHEQAVELQATRLRASEGAAYRQR
jgi:hypothetical protein